MTLCVPRVFCALGNVQIKAQQTDGTVFVLDADPSWSGKSVVNLTAMAWNGSVNLYKVCSSQRRPRRAHTFLPMVQRDVLSAEE